MLLKKNTKVGKIKLGLFIVASFFYFSLSYANNLEGNYTNIKVLSVPSWE